MSEPLDDLRAVLGAVEPSVGFEQRTMRHIADSQTSRRRVGRWLFVPMASAATLVVVIVLRGGGAVDRKAAAVIAPEPSPVVSLPLPSAVVPEIVPRLRMPRPAPRRDVTRVRLGIPETAHVDQALAVRRLVARALAGDGLSGSDEKTFNEDGSIAIPASIDLKPIVIAPLTTVRGGGSER